MIEPDNANDNQQTRTNAHYFHELPRCLKGSHGCEQVCRKRRQGSARISNGLHLHQRCRKRRGRICTLRRFGMRPFASNVCNGSRRLLLLLLYPLQNSAKLQFA
jgi:hypothetical protein